MESKLQVEAARALAKFTLDKETFEHSSRLADRVSIQMGAYHHRVAVAWLHDVLEDADLGEGWLRDFHIFTDEVVRSVCAITRWPATSYEEYLRYVKQDTDATYVKAYDMEDNLYGRPSKPPISLRERYEKGLRALGRGDLVLYCRTCKLYGCRCEGVEEPYYLIADGPCATCPEEGATIQNCQCMRDAAGVRAVCAPPDNVCGACPACTTEGCATNTQRATESRSSRAPNQTPLDLLLDPAYHPTSGRDTEADRRAAADICKDCGCAPGGPMCRNVCGEPQTCFDDMPITPTNWGHAVVAGMTLGGLKRERTLEVKLMASRTNCDVLTDEVNRLREELERERDLVLGYRRVYCELCASRCPRAARARSKTCTCENVDRTLAGCPVHPRAGSSSGAPPTASPTGRCG